MSALSFSSENQRVCSYDCCCRLIVTDAPSMLIGHGVEPNKSVLCAFHERQLTDDFKWLTRNLSDLTEYRLNRAYGHKSGGGGNRGYAPSPMRDSLSDTLTGTCDDGMSGLQATLYGWARSMALNLPENTPLADMLARVRDCYRLLTTMATGAYAEDLHTLVRRLRRFLSDDDGEIVLYGPCEAKGCDGNFAAYPDSGMASCDKCGFEYPVQLIRAHRVQRLLQSDAVRTRGELLDIIKACGMHVNRSTLRSWIHRGQLPQQGEDSYSNPLYRFSDFYRLATGLSENADVWEIMQAAQNQSKEGDNQ